MNSVDEAWVGGYALLKLPLRGERDVWMKIPRDMSEETWNQFMALLDVMKAGFVHKMNVPAPSPWPTSEVKKDE